MQSGQGVHILTGHSEKLNYILIMYTVDIDMLGVYINIIYIMRSYGWSFARAARYNPYPAFHPDLPPALINSRFA